MESDRIGSNRSAKQKIIKAYFRLMEEWYQIETQIYRKEKRKKKSARNGKSVGGIKDYFHHFIISLKGNWLFKTKSIAL